MDPTIHNVTQSIINQYETLWSQAENEAPLGSSRDTINAIFIWKLREAFRSRGKSLQQVSRDVHARQLFCNQDKRLRKALKTYERTFNISPARVPLFNVAQEVFEARDQLWRKAESEVMQERLPIGKGTIEQRITQRTEEVFVEKVKAQFKEKGWSLSDVLKDPAAHCELAGRGGRLQRAMEAYGRAKGIAPETAPAESELVRIARSIFDKRDQYFSQAVQMAGRDPLKQLFIFTQLIRASFQASGKSLSEIFDDPVAKGVFMQSERLKAALQIYLKIKEMQREAPREAPQEVPPEVDPEQLQREEAKRLAVAHAAGEGFVTQLGFKEELGDQAALRREVRQFLVRNHPDKNPDSDPEMVRAATQLLEMLGRGTFEEYRRMLEKRRGL